MGRLSRRAGRSSDEVEEEKGREPPHRHDADSTRSADRSPRRARRSRAGFEIERIWASLGTLTNQKSVEQAINAGAGFVHCAGHANPTILVTYPPLDTEKEQKITILGMYNIPPLNEIYALFFQKKGIAEALEKLQESWMPQLSNDEKQPVVVVGGCHNCQFNITTRILKPMDALAPMAMVFMLLNVGAGG